jgi:uncharacterized protein (TIGR03000 family)
MLRTCWYWISRSLIAVAVLLLAARLATDEPSKLWLQTVQAHQPTPPRQWPGAEPSTTRWPWNAQGYQRPARPPERPAPRTTASPQRYTIQITVLPRHHEDADTALMVAHLPEEARIWFDDEPTTQTGMLRRFVSPPLKSGKTYHFTVRVTWPEEGRWVSQMHTFPVHAGDVHCIDVIPGASRAVDKEVAASLAKLSLEDRKAAEAQRFCAVQEGIRLGAMGVPVKLTVKGQPVYLCCKGCEEKAKADPDKILEKVKRMKAKDTGPSSP